MRRKLVIFTAIAIFLSVMSASLALAGKSAGRDRGSRSSLRYQNRYQKNNLKRKSRVDHLYLLKKDPSTWEIIRGAWGKMKYHVSGEKFNFVFNGHSLEPGSEYTLIYYPDPWPGTGLICLGSGTADEEGNVHIKAAANTGDLPAAYDANYDPDTDGDPADGGAKLWLVLSSDIQCPAPDAEGACNMSGWNPTEYLFEYNLITFDDEDN